MLHPGLTALGHEVVGADLPGCDADLALDCTDPVAVDEAVAQAAPDAVVHLAGIPTESSLPDALTSHVVTAGALLEAMTRHGVRRLVLASSNHAVGRTPRAELPDGVLRTGALPRPDTSYGVAKVAAEALAHLHADRHGLDVVALRIGSFLPAPTTRRQLATWLSHDDCVRLVHAALTTPSPGFAVAYGVSANTRGWWDLEPGRALGYDPQDDAEDHAADVEATPESDDDRAEAVHVGGPYATSAFERPSF